MCIMTLHKDEVYERAELALVYVLSSPGLYPRISWFSGEKEEP